MAVYARTMAGYAALTKTDAPDASLQRFIEALPEGAEVLDLGCGPAMASAHMRAAGLRPNPVDASPEMVEFANTSFDIGARIATFDDIAGADLYDGVWANFSLLHAPRADLPRHLTALAKALRPDGVLHLGMKTGAGEARDTLDRFYTYVSVSELTALVHAAGLTVTWTREGTAAGLAGTDDPFVLLHAEKRP